MATQRIAFTEWLPDQPTTTNALLEANNVYPLTVGYGPFPLSALREWIISRCSRTPI